MTGMTGAVPGDRASLCVSLCSSAFSIEAVHRAAYELMAMIDVRIAQVEPDILCELRPLSDKISPADAELSFRREVTDQQLRIGIEQRTGAYRDLILGLAFSKTGLQGG